MNNQKLIDWTKLVATAAVAVGIAHATAVQRLNTVERQMDELKTEYHKYCEKSDLQRLAMQEAVWEIKGDMKYAVQTLEEIKAKLP